MTLFVIHHFERPDRENPHYTRVRAPTIALAIEEFKSLCLMKDDKDPPYIINIYQHVPEWRLPS